MVQNKRDLLFELLQIPAALILAGRALDNDSSNTSLLSAIEHVYIAALVSIESILQWTVRSSGTGLRIAKSSNWHNPKIRNMPLIYTDHSSQSPSKTNKQISDMPCTGCTESRPQWMQAVTRGSVVTIDTVTSMRTIPRYMRVTHIRSVVMRNKLKQGSAPRMKEVFTTTIKQRNDRGDEKSACGY